MVINLGGYRGKYHDFWLNRAHIEEDKTAELGKKIIILGWLYGTILSGWCDKQIGEYCTSREISPEP